MIDRNEVVNPLDAVIKRAADLGSQGRSVHSGAASGGAGTGPASVGTTTGEDGEVRHPMIWGVDKFGDPNALWTED